MLNAQLKVIGGKHDGTLIPLATKRFLIGRERDCHLRPNSELVSRHHCVLTIDDYTVRIRELGSTNGTYVNGELIHGEVVLNSGDHIAIGKLEFEVVVLEPAAVEQAAGTATAPGGPDSAGEAPPESGETMEMAAGETVYEQPAQAVDPNADSAVYGGDTSVMPAPQQGQPGAPQPGQYPPPDYAYGQQPYPYPQPPMPGGYPPGAVPPNPYPAGMYPQPGMYPPPPGGYPPPQQPGGYPPPQQPGGYPPPQQPGGESAAPSVRLPPPESTGARDEPKKQEEGESAPKEDPSAKVADIIRQYRQRRPDQAP